VSPPSEGAAIRKEYPEEYSEDSSHAHAVELLTRAGRRDGGVVLDLGCGNAPVAEPLQAQGFDYVGLDVDKQYLDGLAKRGFEGHKLDLAVSERRLIDKLEAVVGGRRLAAVFALDVLEHLVEPRPVVQALATLAEPHGAVLVVSIPNITHVDVGIRLLLGRWDMTSTGLLDDTHLRFFSPVGFQRLFDDTGWHEVDAFDTVAPFSDQFVLQRSPGLQPGAPIGNLLRRLREQAGPHGTTYQFVRRFEVRPTTGVAGTADRRPADAANDATTDPPRPLVTVVVEVAVDADRQGVDRLRADLEAQTDPDVELLEIGGGAASRNEAIERARGRYMVFLAGRHRVGPRLVECVRRAGAPADDPVSTDCVVRVDAGALDVDDLAARGGQSFPELAAALPPLEPDGFDPLRSGELGHTVLAAYAVPRSVCETLGLRFDEHDADAETTVFVARAVELCGQRAIGDLQVVVPTTDARMAVDDLPALQEQLGPHAFLLPPGGLPKAVIQRDTLGRALAAERALRDEVASLRPRLEAAERDRDAASEHLEAVLATRTWRYAQLPRRLYVQVRQLIERR
jgi:hypothetical protein